MTSRGARCRGAVLATSPLEHHFPAGLWDPSREAEDANELRLLLAIHRLRGPSNALVHSTGEVYDRMTPLPLRFVHPLSYFFCRLALAYLIV